MSTLNITINQKTRGESSSVDSPIVDIPIDSSTADTAVDAVSKKDLYKNLIQMMELLAEVISLLTGNSADQMKLAEKRSEFYVKLVESLQEKMQTKLETLQTKTVEQGGMKNQQNLQLTK